MRQRRCCGTVSIGGGWPRGSARSQEPGRQRSARRRCLPPGPACSPLPLPVRPAPPVERASATAVAILTPAGRETSGITDGVRVGDARLGARLPLPRRRLAPSDRPCRGLRGARLRRCDHGDRLGRPSLGRALRRHAPDRRRPRPRVARERATAQSPTHPASHLVHVRLNGDPIELVPGKKLWVKGWGYAVVDDPVARSDSTGGGDTLAGLRLHLTSAHAGLPAGTDIVLGQVHADLEHIPPAPASDPGGSGGSGSTGTLPDRQANAPGTHHRPVRHRRPHASGDADAAAPPARAATARARQAPCRPAASSRPRLRSTRRARAGGSGPGRLAVRLGRREPHGGRVRLLRPR